MSMLRLWTAVSSDMAQNRRMMHRLRRMAESGHHPLTGEPNKLPNWSARLDFDSPLPQMVANFPVAPGDDEGGRLGEAYVLGKMLEAAVGCVQRAMGSHSFSWNNAHEFFIDPESWGKALNMDGRVFVHAQLAYGTLAHNRSLPLLVGDDLTTISLECVTRHEGQRSVSKASSSKRRKSVDPEVASAHDQAQALHRWAKASREMMQDANFVFLIDFVGHVDAIASGAPPALNQARTAWKNRRQEVANDASNLLVRDLTHDRAMG